MSFSDWMDALDEICQWSFGMSIWDLPDMCFRDAYDDGFSPEEFIESNLPDSASLAELIFS